jgi:hypothetical protein
VQKEAGTEHDQNVPHAEDVVNGQDAGMAKMSPRKDKFGPARAAEFSKVPVAFVSPAVARAPDDAGIVPPLATMAIAFNSPPKPIVGNPRIARFKTTTIPARPTTATICCNRLVCGSEKKSFLRSSSPIWAETSLPSWLSREA